MSVVFFDFLNNKQMSQNLSTLMNADFVEYEHRIFPDGESYFNIQSGVENKTVVILTSLLAPNNKILDLVFIAKTLRELGANDIGIVSPYLGYMRQDKKFKAGEALTSKIFAELLSAHFNWLITVDPHLHRYKALKRSISRMD